MVLGLSSRQAVITWGNLEYETYFALILVCLMLFCLLHDSSSIIFYSFDVFRIVVKEKSKNKEKPLNEWVCPNF